MNLSVRVAPRTFGYQGEVRYEFSEEDQLIGVASICINDTSYLIHFLSVMPDNRGQGYGSRILETIFQILNDKPITLELDKGSPFGMENLRSWYTRHGFISITDDQMIRYPFSRVINKA